ncbi:MAG: transglycosylase SLT domain-containing protein [Pseudomonadota bacterium]
MSCLSLSRCVSYAIFAALWITATPTFASTPESALAAICDRAAIRASREMGVPQPVLLAITRTETARYGTPWPWTVNMEGTGHWFDTRAEAEAFAARRHSAGAVSFDVGCFQINYRWHNEHFGSITEMFDPDANARYAARFLIELYAEFGSWDAAVGAYHSRTERYAARYLRIYHGHLETLGANPVMPAPALSARPQVASVNTYPLLQAGGTTSLGSLVPQTGSARPLFGATP